MSGAQNGYFAPVVARLVSHSIVRFSGGTSFSSGSGLPITALPVIMPSGRKKSPLLTSALQQQDSSGIVPSSADCDILFMSIVVKPPPMPPSAELVTCKFVDDNPGSAHSAFTLLSAGALSRSARVKPRLASFVCAYLSHRAPLKGIMPSASPPSCPPFFSKYSCFRPPEVILRAPLLWLTTLASPRNSAAFVSSGHTSAVKRKWDKWFVCIWVSHPSTVASSLVAIMPALLHSTSSPLLPSVFFSSCAVCFTFSKLMRSHGTRVMSAPGTSCLSAAKASSARAEDLFSMRTLAPCWAQTFAQIRPVPDVQPVTATTLPSMRGSALQKSPKYLLWISAGLS
mmetsp:Transcript_43570/g.79343  ORF Transcript_43570/g.79343 Transcript_43570/m.79343 type:complete len:341 (+) Transcript_43570:122-1144(+)